MNDPGTVTSFSCHLCKLCFIVILISFSVPLFAYDKPNFTPKHHQVGYRLQNHALVSPFLFLPTRRCHHGWTCLPALTLMSQGTEGSRGSEHSPAPQSNLRVEPGSDPAPEPPGAAAVPSRCGFRGQEWQKNGVHLSPCAREVQSLGTVTHAYTRPGLATGCAPSLPSAASSSVASGGSPREGGCLLVGGRTKGRALAAALSRVGSWGSRLRNETGRNETSRSTLCAFLLLGFPWTHRPSMTLALSAWLLQ